MMRLSSVKLRVPALRPSLRRLRSVTALIGIAGAVLLVAGCGPFSAATASQDLPVVKVGVVPGIDNATLYLGVKRGYFAHAGIAVSIVHFTSVQAELQALSAGSVNVAAGDYADLFADRPALQRNAFKILADGYDAAPGVVEIMTMPGSPVKTPADLDRYPIGAPDVNRVSVSADTPDSLVEASATSVLQALRVNLSALSWRPMSQSAELNELVSGQLKAALLTEPYVYLAQQAGAYQLVDACSGGTSGIPLSGYFTSTSWSRDNTNDVAAFRAGLAAADAQASMPGPVQSVLPGYAKLTKEEAALVTTGIYPLSTIPASIQRTADLMWNVGMIRKQLDVSAMIAK